MKKKIFGIIGAGLCLLLCMVIPAPDSLRACAENAGSNGNDAMILIGTIALAALWWAGEVTADWLVAITIQCLWVVLGITPLSGAFASYSNSTIWLFFGVFCITAAVNKTGLVRRIALGLMKKFSPTFRGQVFAILLAGIICSPIIPSATAKVVLGASLACSIADAMEYEHNSPGRYGLFIASLIGFAFICPAFKTAGTNGYALLGVFPGEVQEKATFVYWLLSMLPWLIIVTLGMYIFILSYYAPKRNSVVTTGYVEDKLNEQGKLSASEKQVSVILIACLVFWIFEKTLKIDAATTALCGTLACFSVKLLRPEELSKVVPWPLIVFLGGVLNIGSLMKQTGVDCWIQGMLLPIFRQVDNMYLLILLVVIIIILLRMVIVSLVATITLTMTILVPILLSLGIQPLGIGLVVYATMLCWFTPYQNLVCVPAIDSMHGTIVHSGTVAACIAYEILSLAAFLISVPYWKWIGCI